MYCMYHNSSKILALQFRKWIIILLGFIKYPSNYLFVKLKWRAVPISSFTSNFVNVRNEKHLPRKTTTCMRNEKRLYCKTLKIVASQRPKTVSKSPLDERGYNIREFARHTGENIATNVRPSQRTCHDCCVLRSRVWIQLLSRPYIHNV